jgi:hypothetical protein
MSASWRLLAIGVVGTCVPFVSACGGDGGSGPSPTLAPRGVLASPAVTRTPTVDPLGTLIPAEDLSTSHFMVCETIPEPTSPGAPPVPLESVAVVPVEFPVVYQPDTCEPDIDEAGTIAVRSRDGSMGRQTIHYSGHDFRSPESIVWRSAKTRSAVGSAIMTGAMLKSNAKLGVGPRGDPTLTLYTTVEGARIFREITQRNLGRPLAFFLDGTPIRDRDGIIDAPRIDSPISDAIFFFGLALDQTKRLAALVESGKLQ